jgi:LPXTG-site transpeptidase (sortase) family protein
LNVSAVVREGVDSKTLRRAAGHVPGTALPGDDGNVAVAAHRDTFFRGLRDVRENDRIRMVTPDGTFEYVVRSTTIVTPTDVEVLDPREGKRELTLITCYPFNYVGHAPKRFIVKAEQASVDAAIPARQRRAAVSPAAAVIPAAAVASARAEPNLSPRQSPSKGVTSKKVRSRKARLQARRHRDREGW